MAVYIALGKYLQNTFESVYFKALIDFVKSAYGSAKCFPPIFLMLTFVHQKKQKW